MSLPVRAKPLVTPMRRGRLPACSCRHARVDRLERLSGRKRFPQRDHPIKHHVAGPGAKPRVVDRSKAGRPRAHDPSPHQPRARTTSEPQFNPDNPGPHA
jgi:hypothetical protein